MYIMEQIFSFPGNRKLEAKKHHIKTVLWPQYRNHSDCDFRTGACVVCRCYSQ